MALVCLCALMAAERPAHAYIDPGTGSYAIQAAFAGLFVVLVTLRNKFRQIADSLMRLFKKR